MEGFNLKQKCKSTYYRCFISYTKHPTTARLFLLDPWARSITQTAYYNWNVSNIFHIKYWESIELYRDHGVLHTRSLFLPWKAPSQIPNHHLTSLQSTSTTQLFGNIGGVYACVLAKHLVWWLQWGLLAVEMIWHEPRPYPVVLFH